MHIAEFELEKWMNRHELNVRFDIAESGIAPLTTEELLGFEPAAEKNLKELALGYSDSRGDIRLRQEIAKTYSGSTAENVLVTTGAIEANFLLFFALLNPGDHVIAPFPAYQQLYSVPQAMGCEVSLWRCREQNGFKFDLDELKSLIRPDTKMIVINTPHNPTGAVLTQADLNEIYIMAERVGALVLSDEAYRWLHIPGSAYTVTPAFDLGPLAISVGTMSKPFGLAGLRTGWIAANSEIIERCRLTRHYISLCPGRASDVLATLAFRHQEEIFERNAQIIAANLNTLSQWVESKQDIISYHRPLAGLLCMLRFNLDISSLELADRLAEQYSVLLAPGSTFEMESHLRLGFGSKPHIFQQGIEQADKCISDLLQSGVKSRGVYAKQG